MMKKIIWIVVLLAILVAVYWTVGKERGGAPIGGDRSEQGCLISAGYAYSEEVGACLREFEMTADIKEAARIAVEHVGRGYALSVVSFNSYEEAGAYDIFLERGVERIVEKVEVRGGRAVDSR